MKQEMKTLEILAKSIKAKNKVVSVDTLIEESLFHNFGTLSEDQASELLWKKREEITMIMEEEGYRANSFICPFSLEFIAWCGEKTPWG